ncbi:aspartate--tRNA ligase [Candidatus Peregrinibacteria bacterium]|nr:aspartate--tRNA ligase [Candidatus Peregrinibacteria bacterium]
MYRSHNLNELSKEHDGGEVTLAGWVHRRRDHGGMIFIDLRDRYGLTQIVSDPVNFKKAHDVLETVRSEFVIQIKGKVRLRPSGQENPHLKSGAIEVLVNDVVILNKAMTPPFEIDQEKEISEEMRLTYRYLDLRRERMKNNILLRHRVVKFIRDFFEKNDFVEVETPILIKGTPEGSREYLVPSRLYTGNFYVLPQSPQQLKQLLMIAGFDRYFQIARCFRDEDQRGDRQPEFTQLDLEMSFVDEEDVRKINEELMIDLLKKFRPDKKLKFSPFPVMSYKDAMEKYGSDKPDLRFDLLIVDVSEVAKNCGFGVFADAVMNGGVVKALRVPGGAKFTRKDVDELAEIAKIYKAKGLVYVAIESEGFKSSIVKFFRTDELEKIQKITGAEIGDGILFTADRFQVACESLGQVRLKIGKKLNLIDESVYACLWVNEFPMFEKDTETGMLSAMHHPFTAPRDVEVFVNDPLSAISKGYDLVLDGNEIGGGSIRIHDSEVQSKVFEALKIAPEDAERRFGHMLRAFKYGAPPHGGIAWGIDRLIMLFANEPNIREVIAFPKDQKAKDLMLSAPSEMPEDQIAELHIKVITKD